MSPITKPDHVIRVNRTASLVSDPGVGHNRWHPEIAPIARVKPGETVALELRDGLDGVFHRNSTTRELQQIDWNIDIPMTGPLFIEGAEAGDLLDIEIIDIEPDDVGYTAIIPGFGVLGERFSEPFLVKWRIQGGLARSDELPGVRIPGNPFLGAMGVAPSPHLLNEIDARERALAHQKPLVKLPTPSKAVPSLGNPARSGLRTSPPREFGGNMDIRQLTAGSRLALSVHVQGALFSAGDTHFSQGDGESGGTAIEVAATTVIRFSLTKARDRAWQQRYPTFRFTERSAMSRARQYFATTGMPINARGENGYLDLNEAAKQALSQMIEYLTAGRGYTAQQACVIASVAVDLRVSEAVDVPNPIVSALLPLDIFDT